MFLGCKIKKLLNKNRPQTESQRGRGKFSEKVVKFLGLVSITKKDISNQRVGEGRCEGDYLFETLMKKVKPSEITLNWAFR